MRGSDTPKIFTRRSMTSLSPAMASETSAGGIREVSALYSKLMPPCKSGPRLKGKYTDQSKYPAASPTIKNKAAQRRERNMRFILNKKGADVKSGPFFAYSTTPLQMCNGTPSFVRANTYASVVSVREISDHQGYSSRRAFSAVRNTCRTSWFTEYFVRCQLQNSHSRRFAENSNPTRFPSASGYCASSGGMALPVRCISK